MSDATANMTLYLLLVASLAAACVLILMSTAMVGKKLSERDYQRAAGINGTLRIQVGINVRTHLMRVFVGVTFTVFSVLLLADAPMVWRQWVNRLLFVLVPLGYVVASILDWLAEREQMRIELANAAQVKTAANVLAREAEAQRSATILADRDSYKEMAAEAIAALAVAAEQGRASRGQAGPARLVAVVPEHSSPVSPEQQAEAERATLRAQLVASKLELGLPARDSSPPAEPRTGVDVATIQDGAVRQIVDAVTDANGGSRHEA